MANLISWINIAVVFGSIVLFGAVGETLTEKAGNLNLGTPGIMCMGGAFGFVGAYLYETSVGNPNAFMCILVALGTAFIVSALGGLIYSFLTTTLHANQNVTGLTLTIFGVGLGKFFGTYVIPKGAVSTKAERLSLSPYTISSTATASFSLIIGIAPYSNVFSNAFIKLL